MSDFRRVLVVDDDDDIRAGAITRLRMAGFETLQAVDGEQGLECARTAHPDAVVLDVRMPVKDGLAALRELRSLPETRDIPVVMLSASLSDEQAALRGGAAYFLRKPYQGRSLIAAIRSALESA
jgi:CheY-like chemotaxis protein